MQNSPLCHGQYVDKKCLLAHKKIPVGLTLFSSCILNVNVCTRPLTTVVREGPARRCSEKKDHLEGQREKGQHEQQARPRVHTIAMERLYQEHVHGARFTSQWG